MECKIQFSKRKFKQLLVSLQQLNIKITEMNMQTHRYPHRPEKQFQPMPRNTMPNNMKIQYQNGNNLLRQRPPLNQARNANPNYAKICLQPKKYQQTGQDYLKRNDGQQTHYNRYENQIQKLTKICEQFFHENQRLKQKLNTNIQSSNPNSNPHPNMQVWMNRIRMLELELDRSRQTIQQKNRHIAQLSALPSNMKYQLNQLKNNGQSININLSPNPNINMGNAVGNNLGASQGDNSKVQRLLLELKSRENQLLKYVHKQSQYVQMYVDNERLQQEIRNLETVVQSQKKQIQQYRRYLSKLQKDQTSFNSSIPFSKDTQLYNQEQNRLETECQQHLSTISKITDYNDKLSEMLRMSSSEIERLNNLLKQKLQQVQNNKLVIDSQFQQLFKLRQNELDRENQKNDLVTRLKNQLYLKNVENATPQQTSPCRDCENMREQFENILNKNREFQNLVQQRSEQISQLQAEYEQTKQEKQNLQRRLSQQVNVSWQLKQLLVKMEQFNRSNQQMQIHQMKARSNGMSHDGKQTSAQTQQFSQYRVQNYERYNKLADQFQTGVQTEIMDLTLEPIIDNGYNGYRNPYMQLNDNYLHSIEEQDEKQAMHELQEMEDQLENKVEDLNLQQVQRIKMCQQRINNLKQQNEQLTTFIIRQTDQISKLKEEVKHLEGKKKQLQAFVYKMNTKDEIISGVVNKVSSIQQKVQALAKYYEKMLSDIESSCNQAESLQRQIDHMKQQKSDIFSQDYLEVGSMKEVSHTNSQSVANMRKLFNKNFDYIEPQNEGAPSKGRNYLNKIMQEYDIKNRQTKQKQKGSKTLQKSPLSYSKTQILNKQLD